jgi:selenocysteine lyase/cysteine desulfurase
LGTFSIDGIDVGDISTRLFSEYQIHTVSIKWENVNAVRVTPHVYTTTKDLDRFVDAVLKIAAS